MTDTKDDPRTKPTAAQRLEIFTGAGRRRNWGAEEKARIVAETLAPGASVSAIARAHGLTPAQLFRWRRDAGAAQTSSPPALSFAPVVVSESASPAAVAMIEIELRGARLRVPSSTRPTTIVALLKALRSTR